MISHGVLFLGTHGPASVFNLMIFLLAFQLHSVSSFSKGECLHLCTLSSPWVLRVAQIRTCPMVEEFSSGLRKAKAACFGFLTVASWVGLKSPCCVSSIIVIASRSCSQFRAVLLQGRWRYSSRLYPVNRCQKFTTRMNEGIELTSSGLTRLCLVT